MVVVGAINSLLSLTDWRSKFVPRGLKASHPGSLIQFQWGGRRSLVRRTCPPSPHQIQPCIYM